MLKVGDRVKVHKIVTTDTVMPNGYYEQFKDKIGTIVSEDGTMYKVRLDKFRTEGLKIFFHDELVPFIPEGGGDARMVVITYEYILKHTELSAFEKLAYIIVNENDPATWDILLAQLSVNRAYCETIMASLTERKLVVADTEKGKFWPAFQIISPGAEKTSAEKTKETKDAKKKTEVSDKTADEYVFYNALRRYHMKRGVRPIELSKNAKKIVRKVVEYTNELWLNEDKNPDIKQHFKHKSEMYDSYIEHCFGSIGVNELNHMKRMLYAGIKAGWRGKLRSGKSAFAPHLLPVTFNKTKYFGIDKKQIPEKAQDSGYWATVHAFLVSKWDAGNYPVAKPVLYALEVVLAYMSYRNQDITKLKGIHTEYVKEYKKAEVDGKLDDLKEYLASNKKKKKEETVDPETGECCVDCIKRSTCRDVRSNAIVLQCTDKEIAG